MSPNNKKQFGFSDKSDSGGVASFFRNLSPGLIYAVVFLLIVLLAWAGLLFWSRAIQQTTADVEASVEDLREKRNTTRENVVLDFGKQVRSLKTRLEEQQTFSPLLLSIEEATHPEVSYSNLRFSFADFNLELDGEARNLRALAEQIAAYRQSDFASSVSLGSVNSEQEGGVKFSLTVAINLDFLNN